ncbi:MULTISPECIES: hypothetical protein [16SrI (Aster yellows group)]|nr:hypothetical protein [Chrysanthemum yellows phytoplasma]QKX95269.1 MAG: hypothetical protein RP166_2750 [Rapeseed phyllody phytoplasma]
MTYKATLPTIDSNLTLSFKTKQKENELKEVDYAYYDLVNNDNQVNNNMSVILRFRPFVAPFCLDEKKQEQACKNCTTCQSNSCQDEKDKLKPCEQLKTGFGAWLSPQDCLGEIQQELKNKMIMHHHNKEKQSFYFLKNQYIIF